MHKLSIPNYNKIMKKLLLLLLTFVLVGCVSVSLNSGEDNDESGDVAEEITEEVVVDESEEIVEDVEEEVVEDEENIGCGGPDCDNEMLISSYYKLIADGDLSTAYAMKYEPNVNYETFKGWYGNVLFADVRDYEEIDDNKYQFVVDLGEVGDVKNSFMVVMVVRGGLLDTLSSTNMTIKSGTEVYVKVFSDGDDLYVKKDGEEIFVDSLRMNKNDPVMGESLYKYHLTDDGKYLAYQVGVWEAMYVNVYDIESEKFIYEEFGVTSFGFTAEEDFFYACTEAGMLGDMMRIYNVPSFSLKRDLLPAESGLIVMYCNGYASYNNSYSYTLTSDWSTENKQVYYFDTNTVE